MYKNSGIYHLSSFPWVFVNQENICTIMLRTGLSEASDISIFYGDPFDFSNVSTDKSPRLIQLPMEKMYSDSEYEYYRAVFMIKTHKLRYHFQFKIEDCSYLYCEVGISTKNQENLLRPFYIPYLYEDTPSKAPLWVKDVVWYQIFPDRFSNGNHEIAKSFLPTRDNYYGGTLNGILEKLSYLSELGITGIYLNPIFESNSNHKYDTIDYTKISPDFGTNEDFITLTEKCHEFGIKVMMDGVFNHCGYDSELWQDVLRMGKKSRYYDWFIVYDEEAIKTEDCRNLTPERMKVNPPYEAFAFAANMPKWNTQNPEVMDYLIGAAEHWTRLCHIDAWRLDVPDEVNIEFLQAFYQRIKSIDSNIYITGEIWNNAAPWLQKNLFDGVMNYPLYFAIRDFALLQEDDAIRFCDRMTRCFVAYPEEVQSNLLNFCSNHDVPRALFLSGNHISGLKAAYLLIFLLQGCPSIYYGDEIGLTGGDDPDNRRAMLWDNCNGDLFEFFKSIISIRKKFSAFDGWKRTVNIISKTAATVSCESERERLSVICNMGDRELTMKLNTNVTVLLGNISMNMNEIMVPAYASGLLLVQKAI